MITSHVGSITRKTTGITHNIEIKVMEYPTGIAVYYYFDNILVHTITTDIVNARMINMDIVLDWAKIQGLW